MILFWTCTILLSGKNDVFNRFTERSKDDWEVGVEQTRNELVNHDITKHNNMVKQGRWKQVEPKDVTIVTLAIQIPNLEKKIKIVHAPTVKSNASNPPTSRLGTKSTLKYWCIIFNRKEKVVDGKTWYQCLCHKMEGV